MVARDVADDIARMGDVCARQIWPSTDVAPQKWQISAMVAARRHVYPLKVQVQRGMGQQTMGTDDEYGKER